jgi:hypothetical protein
MLLFTTAMIPEVMWFSENPMPFALAISRIASLTAVLGLGVLASVQPRLWHLASFAICAGVFFFWTYQDTGVLNDLERQAEKLVSTLPCGRRESETITPRGDSRMWFINHTVQESLHRKMLYVRISTDFSPRY